MQNTIKKSIGLPKVAVYKIFKSKAKNSSNSNHMLSFARKQGLKKAKK